MKKLASIFLSAVIVCAAGTAKRKVSRDLTSTVTKHPSQTVQVIVQWTEEVGAATAQKITTLGGTVIAELPSVHSGVYALPAAALDSLSMDANVKFISADRKILKKASLKKLAGPAAATVNAPYAWRSGYDGTGIGVAIVDSGIDTDDNLSSAKITGPVYSEDFTGLIPKKSDGKVDLKAAKTGSDWYGHGQHIAGIIASNGKESNCSKCNISFIGIAPGVNLINLKVLDANGEGSDSSVIAAIGRAITLKDTYNIRVLNLSLGRPVYESYTQDPLCQAVEAAWKAGIVVVVSAGNDGRDNSFGNGGYATINAPGNDPYVLTVGAMRDLGTADRADDLIASYSSKGPTLLDHVVKPDLVAPGNHIVSLLAQHGTLALNNPQNIAKLDGYQDDAPRPGVIPPQPNYDPASDMQPPAVKIGPGYSKKYYTMNGTSMAAGVVTGAVADLLQAAPSLTPDQVKMLLMQTASKTFPTVSTVMDSSTGQSFTSYYDIFTVGAGYLDLRAALRQVNQVPTGLTALSPTATYDSTTGDVELAFDPSSLFSDRSMWSATSSESNRTMWGAGSIWSSSVLVGNRAMWGANSTWAASSDSAANRAMWGASAIWGDRAMWGANTKNASESILIDGEQ